MRLSFGAALLLISCLAVAFASSSPNLRQLAETQSNQVEEAGKAPVPIESTSENAGWADHAEEDSQAAQEGNKQGHGWGGPPGPGPGWGGHGHGGW